MTASIALRATRSRHHISCTYTGEWFLLLGVCKTFAEKNTFYESWISTDKEPNTRKDAVDATPHDRGKSLYLGLSLKPQFYMALTQSS
jgi:hypothetical protein